MSGVLLAIYLLLLEAKLPGEKLPGKKIYREYRKIPFTVNYRKYGGSYQAHKKCTIFQY